MGVGGVVWERDEIEGWKEREERRCVRQKIPSLVVHTGL